MRGNYSVVFVNDVLVNQLV